MKKKLWILLTVLLCGIVLLFLVTWFGMRKEAEKTMLEMSRELVFSVLNADLQVDYVQYDYDRLRAQVKKPDGSELADRELADFLVNTGLYRLMLCTDEPAVSYSARGGFGLLNADKGSVTLSFEAPDGTPITIELDYVDAGTERYFVTEDYKTPSKKKVRYPFATDLAVLGTMTFNEENAESDSIRNCCFSCVQDEQGTVAVELYEETKEDMKLWVRQSMNLRSSAWKLDPFYDIHWNETMEEVSVYVEEETAQNQFFWLLFAEAAMIGQALEGNEDWHLTIHYYDCETGELLHSQVVR